jgi:hypothetical protein
MLKPAPTILIMTLAMATTATRTPEIEKEYRVYNAQLGNLSNFVDTSLPIEMKEKATREIVSTT